MAIDLLVPASALAAAMAVARDGGFDLPARKMTFGLAAGASRRNTVRATRAPVGRPWRVATPRPRPCRRRAPTS
jgi:hypothetical protein